MAADQSPYQPYSLYSYSLGSNLLKIKTEHGNSYCLKQCDKVSQWTPLKVRNELHLPRISNTTIINASVNNTVAKLTASWKNCYRNRDADNADKTQCFERCILLAPKKKLNGHHALMLMAAGQSRRTAIQTVLRKVHSNLQRRLLISKQSWMHKNV